MTHFRESTWANINIGVDAGLAQNEILAIPFSPDLKYYSSDGIEAPAARMQDHLKMPQTAPFPLYDAHSLNRLKVFMRSNK